MARQGAGALARRDGVPPGGKRQRRDPVRLPQRVPRAARAARRHRQPRDRRRAAAPRGRRVAAAPQGTGRERALTAPPVPRPPRRSGERCVRRAASLRELTITARAPRSGPAVTCPCRAPTRGGRSAGAGAVSRPGGERVRFRTYLAATLAALAVSPAAASAATTTFG